MSKELPFPHSQEIQLAKFTTFGIGGTARFFSKATSIEQIQEMLAYAYRTSIPVFILGKGSNTLFDDRGFDGLVILNRIDYLEQISHGLFRAGSGFSFARMGSYTAREGWSGLEFASGIPATVGGAIYMNAGANGKETANVLSSVRYVTEKGEIKNFEKSALNFAYRQSIFQGWKGAIVEGVFQLHSSLTASQTQKAILNYRVQTQPYGDKSAGCAFRNPPDSFAGELIDSCGLKGLEIGAASVSNVHGNFIINKGGAKAKDVLDLIAKIKDHVYQKKGILLEEEIRYVPYEHTL